MKHLYKYIFLLLLINELTNAQRLKLIKADILESKTIKKESVKLLNGNVEFQKGLINLKCEKGLYKEKKEIAQLYNNVKVSKKNLLLNCDSIIFYAKDNKLESTGDPKIQDDEYSLFTDTLIYFTELDSGVALGNAELFQNNQKKIADKIEYKKNPKSNNVSYKATGNVFIEDSVINAFCGMAIYNNDTQKTILDIKPKIIDSVQTLYGEKIIMSYNNKILKNIYIPKNARANTILLGYKQLDSDSTNLKNKTKFNDIMTSNSLIGFFNNGLLDSLKLSGMATTTYHVFEDSLFKGKNEASGDTIKMNFDDKKLTNIYVKGGSMGEYIPDTISNKLKSPLIYSAEKIDYYVASEETELIGNAKVNHEYTELEAGYMKVNWPRKILNALPINQDSIYKSIKPKIIENNRDPMIGNEMIYNLETKRGKIIYGKTTADDGFYKGKEIRNEDNKIVYIQNSIFTTCDLDTPHFHFESNKMKIVQNDVVIARPIILKISQIPIFGIPLAIFPHQGGTRHSGWIMPGYGESKSRGQFIDGLGYYWAPNDYWDSKLTLSFGDRQGAVLNILNQYRLRYKFNGRLFIRNQQFLSESEDIISLKENRNSNFLIRWNHSQILRNNQTFNANTTYSSNGEYNRKYGLDLAQRMDQKATSNATYTKRWPKSKNSISLNFYSNEDLLAKEKTDKNSNYYVKPSRAGSQINITNTTFPKFSFRHGQSNLIPSKNDINKWYNNINWNYGFNYTSKDRNYYESTYIDSLEDFDWKRNKNNEIIDTLFIDKGWTHTASINMPSKLFKYITINPRVTLKSSWVYRTFDKKWNEQDSLFQSIEKDGFDTRTTGSFSINANTKIYGAFPIPIGPLKVIRHVASPSIGYSWTPDFSKPLFGQDLGYFEKKINPITQEETNHDRFSGTMAGSTPKNERKNINLSLNNIFQAKMMHNEEETKVDLLSWRLSTSYNFAADEFNLSNLRSSIRSKIFGKLNLDLSMTHDFYAYNLDTGQRQMKFNKNENGILSPRLINARLSTGIRLSDKSLKEKNKISLEDSTNINTDISGPGINNNPNNFNSINSRNLWSSNLSISYNINSSNPLNINKTFWINTSTNIQITKSWKLAYRARFDMIEKDLVSQNISLRRDLHCWEFSLNWTPGGLGQGVYVKINVKSPSLKDLKVEKKGGQYSKSPF